MFRPLLALIVLSLFASDSLAQCGNQRQPRRPVRNAIAAIAEAIQEIRPANHPRMFPRLAAAPAHGVVTGCPAGVCTTGDCTTGSCATGACANGSCPTPGVTIIGQTGPGVLGSTPSTFRIVPLAK